MGMKPGDEFAVPLCTKHHAELHTGGARTFERSWAMNLGDIAAELAQQSPYLKLNTD